MTYVLSGFKRLLRRCAKTGCWNRGNPCYLPGDEFLDKANEYYCIEHMADAGYCYICGVFSAGIESFDFGPFPGLCDNCAEQVESDTDGPVSDDEEYETDEELYGGPRT